MNQSPISNSLFLPEAGKGLRPAAVRNRGTSISGFEACHQHTCLIFVDNISRPVCSCQMSDVRENNRAATVKLLRVTCHASPPESSRIGGTRIRSACHDDWIGLRDFFYRKPSIFPLNMGLSGSDFPNKTNPIIQNRCDIRGDQAVRARAVWCQLCLHSRATTLQWSTQSWKNMVVLRNFMGS